MIALSTLNALCEEAGIDPTRVHTAVIAPFTVTFEVYSMNIHGEKMVHRDGDRMVKHWVRSQVNWAE